MKNIAIVFLVLTVASTSHGLIVNCTTFNPSICQGDAHVSCFTDGVITYNDCDAKEKICDPTNTAVIDESGASCLSSPTSTDVVDKSGASCLRQLAGTLLIIGILHFLFYSVAT